ncbi:cytochrome c oxidase subunit 5B, mitochondrial [Lingula anatina]|uniref:Cytochrome c oxidase subunit 5B, mitochondrial n=1 Tax=Lingula anatina TaxID=7574 RepID=A0A1S3K3W0_LINAN|nr:cytochrome c oxidase subunit 5B, mitochondrial [Lingula anatina]|eukprot:XP_013417212.1 cytochrome c oxidase subunit 5B, mitochondrial [Lingula anatina]
MALVRRAASSLKNVVSRQLCTSSVCLSDYKPPAQDVMRGRQFKKGIHYPDSLGYSMGEHRAEILEDIMGVDSFDVYDYRMIRQNVGTREFPNLVPSVMDHRLIGCVCEEESHAILWMELHEGEPSRCSCGYWFQLVNVSEEADKQRQEM